MQQITKNKWQSYGESIFITMSRLAAQYDAVNLAQGFPDFDGPNSIIEGAVSAIKNARNQYAPSSGIDPLKQAVSAYREDRSGMKYDWVAETTIFSGATEAIWCALMGLVDCGDEVITFAPFYDSYLPGVEARGGKLIDIPLGGPSLSFAFESLENAISEKTKGLILNHPHNPSGRVFNAGELAYIAEFVKKHNLWVITDEVYEELVFDHSGYHYFANLPGMRERTVAISSTSKTFSMTGWKVGFAFAPPELTAILRAVHQNTVFCSATPLQWGMVEGFKEPKGYFESLRASYRKKRNILAKGLRDSGLEVYMPQGTYFLLASYQNLGSHKDDVSMAFELVENARVSSVPISYFFQDRKAQARKQILRFAFCKEEHTLFEAIARLQNYWRASGK